MNPVSSYISSLYERASLYRVSPSLSEAVTVRERMLREGKSMKESLPFNYECASELFQAVIIILSVDVFFLEPLMGEMSEAFERVEGMDYVAIVPMLYVAMVVGLIAYGSLTLARKYNNLSDFRRHVEIIASTREVPEEKRDTSAFGNIPELFLRNDGFFQREIKFDEFGLLTLVREATKNASGTRGVEITKNIVFGILTYAVSQDFFSRDKGESCLKALRGKTKLDFASVDAKRVSTEFSKVFAARFSHFHLCLDSFRPELFGLLAENGMDLDQELPEALVAIPTSGRALPGKIKPIEVLLGNLFSEVFFADAEGSARLFSGITRLARALIEYGLVSIRTAEFERGLHEKPKSYMTHSLIPELYPHFEELKRRSRERIIESVSPDLRERLNRSVDQLFADAARNYGAPEQEFLESALLPFIEKVGSIDALSPHVVTRIVDEAEYVMYTPSPLGFARALYGLEAWTKRKAAIYAWNQTNVVSLGSDMRRLILYKMKF